MPLCTGARESHSYADLHAAFRARNDYNPGARKRKAEDIASMKSGIDSREMHCTSRPSKTFVPHSAGLFHCK